jgi:pimeloyl-ACP methyl ester carboxylesterase
MKASRDRLAVSNTGLLMMLLLIPISTSAQAPERSWVYSKDGTIISVQKTGSGPALLLIHGSSVDGSSWQGVLPGLSKYFTVYVMDRRGHGNSGDAKAYTISVEGDDIAAVTAAIRQPVTILGHSYGALCVLIALDKLQHARQLILYESPLTTDTSPPIPPDAQQTLAKMDRALEANEREEILTLFLRDFAKVSPVSLATMKAASNWAARVDMAAALPREIHAALSQRVSKNSLARCKIPLTLFVGSTSPASAREATDFICHSVLGCRVLTLEGQGHLAALSAPDLLVTKIREAASPVY